MKNIIPLLLLYFSCGIIHAQPIPSWQWLRTQSGTGNEQRPYIAHDAAGCAYVFSNFAGPSLAVGANTYTNTGSNNFYSDAVFAKYDAMGNIAWSKHIATYKNETGYAVAVDKWGNIYIAGSFWGDTLDIEGTILHQAPNIGGGDILLAKYRSNGTLVWARAWGDSLSDWASALGFDTAGNVYMAGSFNSFKIKMGGYTLNNVSSNTYTDGFISKLDTNGNVLWASRFGNRGSEYVNDIAIDKAGNVFVTGHYMGMSPHLQPDTIFPFARFDEIYLLKYSANGTLLWGQNAGGGNNDGAFSVSLDKDENPIIVGYIWGNVYFEGQLITVTGNPIAAYMAKYHASLGQLQWVNRYSSFSFNDIGHDTTGNLYLAGSYNTGASLLDTIPLPAATNMPFVAKFNTSERAIWVKPSAQQSSLDKLVVNPTGNTIYVAGTYGQGFTWVDSVTYANSGSNDILLAKLALQNASQPINIVATVVQPSCQGMADGSIHVAVNHGQAPYTYTWNVNGSDSSLQNLAAGIYSVTVHDATGDSAVYTAMLVAPPLPVASITATADTVCMGDSIVLTAAVSAIQPYTQTWLVNGLPSTATSQVLYTSSIISITVTDANQCQTTVADTLTVLPLPQASISYTADTLCAGDSILLYATTTGNGPFVYTWQVGGGLLASDSIFVYEPGIVVLTATDANQCWANDTLAITGGNCISVGMGGVPKQASISLYPNPTRNGFSIYSAGQSLTSVAIYDITGSLVQYLDKPIGGYIDISRLAAGIYTVNVNTQSGTACLRLIKQ